MVYITAVRVGQPPAHERVEAVRWWNPETNETGTSMVAGVVTWIRDQKGEAKVHDGRSEVDVGVVDGDPPFLRTFANRKWTDNLLALPRF